MKRITCSFHARNSRRWAFVVAGTICAAATAMASLRPRYAGTLRVHMSERVVTTDPRQLPPDSVQTGAAERVDALIFDRLVRFDPRGDLQPGLAISWQHDAQSKRWVFQMRKGVKFADSSPLTPEIAALALQQLLGNSFDVSADSDSVTVQADHSIPDFLEELGAGRYFIFHTTTDGGIFGTGPFQVTEGPSDAAAKVVLTANESCWAGRPFVDKVELTMGETFERQANAIAVGQADVVELPASQVRRAAQRNVRIVSSDPVELFALQFNTGKLEVQDARLRQAISLAVDRASIAEVILQRQAVVAGGLLPNWLSGYAHLFPVTTDLAHARELLKATGREVSRPAPLVLVYDSGDADARAVAERVVVNLREAGIVAQNAGQFANAKNNTWDMRLGRYRIAAPNPGIALAGILSALGQSPAGLETPEEDYAAERAPIDAFLVIPLVHVSESYGLSAQVRNWMPPRWGGWRLEDVWLDQPPAAGEKSP